MTTTDKTKKGRVFSYARWSSDQQSFGDSQKRQLEMANDWCRRNGCALEEQTYTDRGVSGWRGQNRQSGALAALLRIVEPGDRILIEDNDRWSREPVLDSLNALRDAVRRGLTIVFLKTGITVNKSNFDDPSVLFPNFFQSFLANQENQKRSERVRSAMAARRKTMESGTPVKGRLPCWLDWSEKEGKPVVNAEKAAVVKKLFDLCIAGHGLSQIERLMKDIPPITYRPSYRSQIARWNGFFIHRTLSDRSVLGFQRSSGLKIYPAIIDEQTFYRAAAKLKSRKKLTVAVNHQNNNLFTGLVTCGRCGSTYYRLRAKAKNKAFDYLVCSGALRHATSCRKLQAVNYERLEKSFLSLMSQTDLIQRALFGQRQSSRVDAIQAELDDTRRQCEKYVKLIEIDENPSRRMVENLKLLEAKEDRLTRELETEQAKAMAQVAPDKAYEQFQASLTSEPENRSKLSEILRDLVDKIVVQKGGRDSEYSVHLKSAKTPITIMMRQTGWLIGPIDVLPGHVMPFDDPRVTTY
jgi:DNA invertase Pin-like site-specific DNA recombinase